MDQQGRIEKKNKNLGTEKCKNIDTLYINKYHYLPYDTAALEEL